MGRYTKYPHIFKSDRIVNDAKLNNMMSEKQEIALKKELEKANNRRSMAKKSFGSIAGVTWDDTRPGLMKEAQQRQGLHHRPHAYHSVDFGNRSITHYPDGGSAS